MAKNNPCRAVETLTLPRWLPEENKLDCTMSAAVTGLFGRRRGSSPAARDCGPGFGFELVNWFG